MTIATLDELRTACDALTPAERKTFAGPTPAERAERARAHAARHAAWKGTALAFRFGAAEVKAAAPAAGEAPFRLAATPALRGLGGALSLRLTDLETIDFALGAVETEAAARAHASGAAFVHLLVLPDADTMTGAACFTYPKSESYQLQGLLLEAALVRASDGAVLARTRTPLYATWEAELGRRAPPSAPGPRVAAGKVRVVAGSVAAGELGPFADALAPRLLPCWTKALAAAPGSSGALVVSATVDRKGRVRATAVSVDMLHAKEATACVLAALGSGSAPRASTAEAVLALPLYFEP